MRRVVVQGGGCGCRDCWRGKSGREKRYGQRGCLSEASGKSLGESFCLVVLRAGREVLGAAGGCLGRGREGIAKGVQREF